MRFKITWRPSRQKFRKKGSGKSKWRLVVLKVPGRRMTRIQAPLVRMSLTLRQMMKLVIFAAAASMCLVPMVQLAEAGIVDWQWVILGEAVGIPVVLALVAFPLVRRGPSKDWLIRMLLLTSVSIALGFVVYSLIWGGMIWAGTGVTRGILYFAMIVLTPSFVYLLRQLAPFHRQQLPTRADER